MSSKPLPAPAKRLFRYLFEQASLGIAVEDIEGGLLLANPALCSMLGYTEEELCRMSCSQFANSEDSQEDWALFQQLRAGSIDHYSLEKRYVRKDGAPLWGRLNVSLLKSGDGGEPLAFAFVEEITERKQTEKALRESEQRFRLAIQAGRMYAFDWDVVTDVITRSAESGSILNWTNPERDTGREFHARIHPDDLQKYGAVEAGLTPENPTYQTSFRVLRPNGNVIWLEDTGSAFFDTQGKLLRMMGIVADVTQRKQAEEALRESETRERAKVEELEAILNAVPVPVLIAHDPDCKWITGNRAACEQLRVTSGQNFSLSTGSEERPAFRNIEDGVEIPPDLLPIQQTVATGKPVFGRLMTMRFEDGTVRDEVVNVVPMLDDAGKPRGAVAASIDVTEQRRTERALRESEDKLRLLLDSTAEAIYGIDLEYRCTFCNHACLRVLGYERTDEVVGKNIHELIHHTRADGTVLPVEDCKIHWVAKTGKGVHAEDEVLWRANGTSFPAEYWCYPQRRGQEVVGAVVAFTDITHRKLAEAALANVSRKLIEAQEQERTRIARELHDDIGQRLAMLAVELELQKNSSDLPPAVAGHLGDLWRELTWITTDIQSLSHELHSSRLQYLGITAAMRSFCKEFGEQQRVQIDFVGHDLPRPLSPDISLCLFRVLQEAMHNSAKHSGVRHFEVRLWEASDEIHLTVSDSGIGFDREIAKSSRGLGLISMEERLKLVNGTLSIDSRPNRGTTIHAHVPLRSGSEILRAAG